MSAQAQKLFLCLDYNPLIGCTDWAEYDAALIPAADVPTINQFLSVLGDSIYNPTPESILYVFTWGMGAVLFSWSIGYAVGVAVKAIRRV